MGRKKPLWGMLQVAKTKPYTPVTYEAKHVRLIQALANGDATPEMQRDALRWIIEDVSAAYDMPYYDGDRDTAFACGRQYVGKQLVKMTKLIPDRIKPLKEK
jgi:hypothetical protein